MEELLQFIAELILQALFECVGDSIWRRLPEPARVVVKVVLIVALAVLFGVLSKHLFATPIITTRALATVYLVVAPVLIAWGMHEVGKWMLRHDKRRSSLERFGYSWLFAFAFSLTRFVLFWR